MLLFLALIAAFTFSDSLAWAETTNNPYWTQRVMPVNPNPPAVTVRRTPAPVAKPQPQKAPQVTTYAKPIVVHQTPRYIRNSTGGSRQHAISSRSGQAATQVCGGPIEIRHRNGKCNELDYDRHFLEFVQNQGLKCAKSAGQKAFGFTPTKIGLRTHEGQVSLNRTVSGTSSVSNHAIGRAIDVFEVDVYNGSAHNSVVMHRNQMSKHSSRAFYENFRDCWRQEVQRTGTSTLSDPCGPTFGCLDHNYNSAHWDHMHMSLPQTRTNRRRHNIVCT